MSRLQAGLVGGAADHGPPQGGHSAIEAGSVAAWRSGPCEKVSFVAMLISRRLTIGALGLAAALVLPFTSLTAQTVAQPGSATAQAATPDTAHGLPVVSELKALKYRSIGPSQGGRVTRVAGVPGDPNTYYAATASGGVWKSTDGGFTFKAIFDDQLTSTVGSIAVAASNPNVIYAGSGEANIRGNVAPGNGIYKSVDSGKTWSARVGAGRADRHDDRPPAESGRGVRGGARPCVRAESRARRVPDARRRPHVAAGAAEGRRHRSVGRGLQSVQSQRRLRRVVAGTSSAVGARERRTWQRPVRVA